MYLSAIIHGVVVESISYVHPDVDNFWHSQTPIIFLGRRLPLYIIVLCKYIRPKHLLSPEQKIFPKEFSELFKRTFLTYTLWLNVQSINQICISDPMFLYNSSVAVAKMRLPKWAEPFAVGLSVVLIDIPYDIIAIRFMHWTWHDTDPNVYDRHYWVPWNSYYFHATFAATFIFWFHFLREKICATDGKWIAHNR